MKTELELQKIEPSALAVREQPSVGQMLQAVIDKGVTAENVAAIKDLVGLYERMEDRNAEKDFAQAFNALQSEMPKVQATKVIPDKNGKPRSSFAPFEEIDAQARPLCLKHGFTYSFTEGGVEDGRITKICILQHSSGHKRTNPFSVRIGQGPPGCSESQADGAAHSYAKRGALCDALNIVVHGIDNDARAEGGKVTSEQAAELKRRVNETASDEKAFLKFAGVERFEDIPAAKYGTLDAHLYRKENTKK